MNLKSRRGLTAMLSGMKSRKRFVKKTKTRKEGLRVKKDKKKQQQQQQQKKKRKEPCIKKRKERYCAFQ